MCVSLPRAKARFFTEENCVLMRVLVRMLLNRDHYSQRKKVDECNLKPLPADTCSRGDWNCCLIPRALLSDRDVPEGIESLDPIAM